MSKVKTINDVFKTSGQPTITYVERNQGYLEKELLDALKNKGTLVIITGPSKTGKTTLYTRVLSEQGIVELKVRCDKDMSSTDLWKQALEKVDFTQISERMNSKGFNSELGASIEGKFGLGWLASLKGQVNVKQGANRGEEEIRKAITAKPTAYHLISILKEIQLQLVVEDFHYLKKKVQETVFQQWKIFIDEEISVIVVGTSHHARDLADANSDLVGRIHHFDLPKWEERDLLKIAKKGFDYLNVNISNLLYSVLSKESVGLPIVTQNICLQILLDADYKIGNSLDEITKLSLYSTLHKTVTTRYSTYSSDFNRLVNGPRKSRRKYNTYELIFSTFAMDPIVFFLDREEIERRLSQLPIPKTQIPPSGSVTSTLKALSNFQSRLGIELLEWSDNDNRLYILKPTFLFYLRWRKERTVAPNVADLLNEILEAIVCRRMNPDKFRLIAKIHFS